VPQFQVSCTCPGSHSQEATLPNSRVRRIGLRPFLQVLNPLLWAARFFMPSPVLGRISTVVGRRNSAAYAGGWRTDDCRQARQSDGGVAVDAAATSIWPTRKKEFTNSVRLAW
jgi:hypothetical protein